MTWLYRIGAPLVRLWSKIGWRLQIDMQAPLPNGPLILCCNHQHGLDPFALAMATKRQVHYMAKKELMYGFVGHLIRSLGAYPVDRENNDVHAVKHTLSLLKQDRVIGIFPEGTRSQDGEVHEFHSGAAMFALRTKAHLVPAGIYGTFRPFSKVRVVIGKELDLSAYGQRRADSNDIAKVNENLHQRVSELANLARGVS